MVLKIKGEWQSIELENWRYHNHEIIVKLKGVDDREAAQILANVEVGVDLSVFPELEEGDYYWHRFNRLYSRKLRRLYNGNSNRNDGNGF